MLKPTGTVPKPPAPPIPADILEIEDDVPIPGRGSRYNPHAEALRKTLPTMKPGQSVISYLSVATVFAISKSLGITTQRRVEKDKAGRNCIRVWRLK